MDYKVKLGATLSFNLGLERDMVEQINKLKAKHKLGEFISNSLRIVFENPELLEKQGVSLAEYGLTDNRKKLNDAIRTEIIRMNNKIQKTYKMAYEMYSLAKFNKQLNLYDCSRNILASQFILSKQIEDLRKLLGVSSIEQPVNLHKVDTSIDDILEYILLTHSEIVDELKESLTGSNDYLKKLNDLKDLADKHIAKEVETIETQPDTESEDNEDSSTSNTVQDIVVEDEKEDEATDFEISDDANMNDLADLINLF